MSVGINIKKRRYELNMSQDELARLMGYKTRSTIAKIEAEENSVSAKKLEQFARVLDTTVEKLIAGTTTINPIEISDSSKNVVVVLAGGKSTRNQQNIPNQFINVLGKPVIIYSMEAYQKHPSISDIYVVCLKGWEDIVKSYCNQYGISKLRGIIPAGETGILSIKNGLDYVMKNDYSEYIIFQEATRPLITEEIISKLLWTMKDKGSATTCETMEDHIQFLKSQSGNKYINRNAVVDVQSPEGYKTMLLKKEFEMANQRNHKFEESCCAAFMHNIGANINFFEGNHNNIKIIRQEDIAVFSTLLKMRDII